MSNQYTEASEKSLPTTSCICGPLNQLIQGKQTRELHSETITDVANPQVLYPAFTQCGDSRRHLPFISLLLALRLFLCISFHIVSRPSNMRNKAVPW